MKNMFGKAIFFSTVIGFFLPVFASANYLTLPVNVNPLSDTSAWFDHDATAGSFLRYDGDNTDDYDGHNGTDFATSTEAYVLAPASGEVKEVYWDNCGGWQVHLWHEDIGFSTLYAHVGTTTSATTTDLVNIRQHIADVDVTGSCTSGAHLHFGVTDGENRATSNRIDPFVGGRHQPTLGHTIRDIYGLQIPLQVILPQRYHQTSPLMQRGEVTLWSTVR